MSAALTFPQITMIQYAKLRAAAAAEGIKIIGAKGEASAHGCTVAYDWQGWPGADAAPLVLTLVHAPFLCGGIALHTLHDLVEQVLSEPADGPAENGCK